MNGKWWGVRESTLIYACSRKTAKEITVQTLPGNVKSVLKQIVEDLIVDLSKTPSRPFQAWKMERPRSYKTQGLRRGRAALLLGLCSAQLLSLLQTQPFFALCPEVAELRRNLWGEPSKMACVGWREPVLLVERDGQGCSLLLRPTPPHHLSDSKPWDYFCQQLNDFHPIKVRSVPSGNGALRPRYS